MISINYTRQLTLSTDSPKQNQRQFFFQQKFFPDKKILSRAGLCIGLHTAVVFRMQSFIMLRSIHIYIVYVQQRKFYFQT